MFDRIWRGWLNFSQSMELAKAARKGQKITTNDGSEGRMYTITINR